MVGPLDAFTGGGVNLGRVERGSVGGTWHDLTNKRWWKKEDTDVDSVLFIHHTFTRGRAVYWRLVVGGETCTELHCTKGHLGAC